ncbi:hypothetical protein GCM10027570_35940 [Streptomonospora sediminis]
MVKAAIAAAAAVLMLPVLLAAVAAGGATRGGAPGGVPGIPPLVLVAYARAAATLAPECPGLTWAVLAGIGAVESDHATGHDIDATGDITPPVLGPRLDGSGAGGNTTPHPDTDNGRWDRDTVYDRAVGLTQHLPATWAQRGRDADGDGVADPHNAYDAALTTAAGLCRSDSGGVDLSDRAQLRAALLAYNRSEPYVEEVLAEIDRYTALGHTGAAAAGAGSAQGRAATAWALRQVGKPYVWGGTGPAGFDCSGLVMKAWQHAGVAIPRVTTDQYRIGTPVPLDGLRPGDLLFYDTGGPGPAPAHVTMYVGGGKMVNAPSTGKTIRVEPVASDYYSPLLMGIRRP